MKYDVAIIGGGPAGYTAAEKAAAAASNIPQNFSANQASWRSKPNFSIPPAVVRRLNPGDRLRVMVRLTVDKSGTVTSATLAKSSGNTALDNYTVNTAKKGKFNPFTKGGQPVVGVVTLPIDYQVN